MLRCIAVDDEPLALDLLEDNIRQIPYLQLEAKCKNAIEAIEILRRENIDLIFLDIQMPGLTGLQFIQSLTVKPMIILITAYDQYALEGFNLDVIDYLVKPVSFERFLKACEKAYQYQKLKKGGSAAEVEKEDYFFIKCDNAIEKVYYKDLLLVEGMMNYVTLHTTNRKMIVYMTIKSMLEQLPADKFLKVQKSYIVNLEAIKSIEGNALSVGNQKITIGQAYRDEVLSRIVKDKMIRRT